MTEEPKSLKIVQRIYEEANIERNFIIAPNKLFFTIITNPAVLNPFDIEFITADYMFDSMFLEKELTAYLMASDPELASWNRKHHLSYLEDEMKYFMITERLASGFEKVEYECLISKKSYDEVLEFYEDKFEIEDAMAERETSEGNIYQITHIAEIPKSHFDVLP